MNETIDYTSWTTAQLEVGARFARKPEDIKAIADERARRVGTDDGSKARVDALMASSRKRRR